MNFVNQSVAEVTAPLKSAHFPFPRGKELFEAMTWCTTDYYAKAKSGQPFEARGIMVIVESRQGKSREIQRLREKFNDGTVIMPDGRPAKILHCILSGKVTWKDLGVKILGLLGYPLKGRRTQAEIWEKVIKYAELQGVVGIHFDECQHVFVEKGDQTNQQILDSFKILLKESRWPLMLILSGVPSLAQHIAREEQLAFLLRTVRFENIDMGKQRDVDEMLQLTFTYAEKAGLDFDPLATKDFFERLAFSCCNRWGLVIEMLIEALTHGQQNGDEVCTKDHFEHAYAQIYSAPPGYSPFSMSEYRDGFDHARMMELVSRT
ncbi:AAA family ATPase [Marinovum sp.]|uniref:AAA family ATPase n=1 Tax=Marinovum sp. TaxID=2024839 RepID=UPI002B2668FA|nr:AAA family ATPase [Marinovum sp.]